MEGWIVAGPFLALLYVVNKRVNPKGKSKKAVAVITMVICALAGCGLAYTFVGGWVSWAVTSVGSQASKWAEASELTWIIPLALAIIAVGVAVADIAYDKKADKGAQIAAMAFPVLLALVVAGSMGNKGNDAVDDTFNQLKGKITQLGGDSTKGHSGAQGGGR